MVRILGYTTIGVIVSIAGLWLYLDRERGDPVDTFDYFHSVFDERYALFDIKGVDWAGVRDLYFERIDENTTDDELFAILQEILLKLDDRHCYIHRFNQVYFSGFGLPALNYLELLSFDFRFKTEDFSLDFVRSKYLDNSFDRSLRIYSHLPPVGVRSVFTSGWLADSIAYLHMTSSVRLTPESGRAN